STSVPRPRMGVLKVVGTPEPTMPTTEEVVIGDSHYQNAPTPLPENPDIPLIDFGPTQAYVPTPGRPGTSDTVTLLAGNTTPDSSRWFGICRHVHILVVRASCWGIMISRANSLRGNKSTLRV